MAEVHKLRAQIQALVRINYPDADADITLQLVPPSDFQVSC